MIRKNKEVLFMNEAKQKIAKTSKSVAIVLKISFILVAVAMGLLLIGIGFLTLAGSGLSESLQQALTIAAKGTSAAGIAVCNLVIVFGLGIILLVTTFMVLFTLHRLFVNVSREHTPFTKVNVKIMKKVAVWTVIMCIVDFITTGIYSLFISFSDYVILKVQVFGLKGVLLSVKASILVVKSMFEGFDLSGMLATAYGGLDSDVVSALYFFRIPEAINILFSAYTSKKVISFFGFMPRS